MYLDPGLGSMLIQALIAAIAVGGGMLIAMRKKVVAFFRRGKGNEPQTDVLKDASRKDNFNEVDE